MEKDERETPHEFFDKLNDMFNFNLDSAARKENAKCEHWLNDAFSDDWFKFLGKNEKLCAWCNPPYDNQQSRGGLAEWLEMINKKYLDNMKRIKNIVVLLPASTGTAWYHGDYYASYEVSIKGRLRFLRNGVPMGSPRFDSMLWIWGKINCLEEEVLEKIGKVKVITPIWRNW